MSRAIGICSSSFSGLRVAGQLTYVPLHTKNGKNVNQRCLIPVYINSNKGTGRDGTPGRSDQFRMVAWGPLADSVAKSLAKGKAFDCVATPHSYEGRLYDEQRNMRVDQLGQPITVERVGFTIDKIVYGEDSQKEIDREIQEGRRPINWGQTNHPDYQMWLQILQRRQATLYTGGDTFGFARVVLPIGAGIMVGQVAQAAFNQPQAPMAAFNQPPAVPFGQPPVTTPNIGVDPNQLATLISQILKAQPPTTAPASTFMTPVAQECAIF